MIELKITNINNTKYTLITINNKKYELFLEFHNMDKPNINDKIHLPAEYLDTNNETFAQPYAFCNDLKNYEAILETNNKKIGLRRLFG